MDGGCAAAIESVVLAALAQPVRRSADQLAQKSIADCRRPRVAHGRARGCSCRARVWIVVGLGGFPPNLIPRADQPGLSTSRAAGPKLCLGVRGPGFDISSPPLAGGRQCQQPKRACRRELYHGSHLWLCSSPSSSTPGKSAGPFTGIQIRSLTHLCCFTPFFTPLLSAYIDYSTINSRLATVLYG